MAPTSCSRYASVLAIALLASQSSAEVSKESPATDSKTKPAEKFVSVQFDNAPWQKVIEWYQDQSGLEFHSSYAPPTGSFSYYGKRKLTIPEITDLLNEALQVKKYVLLRREATFMLHPADEAVPLELVPRIKIEELKNYGKSEFVSLVYELKHLGAKETAPEIKKMMTPFGQVMPLLRPNLLLMQDKVKTLELIIHVLEHGARSLQPVTELIPLGTLEARAVADMLKAMYAGGDGKTGAPYIEGDQLRNAVIVKGSAEQVADIKAIIKAIGDNPGAAGAPTMRIITIDRGSAATLAEALQTLFPRLRPNPVTVILPGRDMNVSPRDRPPD
jgi:hypothetical protein